MFSVKVLGVGTLIHFFSVTGTVDGLDQYIEPIFAELAKIIPGGEPKVVEEVKEINFFIFGKHISKDIMIFVAMCPMILMLISGLLCSRSHLELSKHDCQSGTSN